MFRTELHLFRAFAIANVVLLHAASFFFVGGDVVRAFTTLFHDSTVYFAIISGLLYTAILRHKGRARFLASRPRAVFAPYVAISIAAIALTDAPWSALLDGTAFPPFWYIPVVAVLYAATPAIEWVVEKRWAWVLVIVGLLSPRTAPDMELTNFLHFAGAYAFGMIVGADYERWLAVLEKYRLFFFTMAALSIVLCMLVVYTGPESAIARSAFFYFRAIAVTLFMLPLLAVVKAPPLVNDIANVAFPIYFLHWPVLLAFEPLGKWAFFPAVVTALVLPVLVVKLLQQRIGGWSRYLVGA